MACRDGHAATAELLVSLGADVSARDRVRSERVPSRVVRMLGVLAEADLRASAAWSVVGEGVCGVLRVSRGQACEGASLRVGIVP